MLQAGGPLNFDELLDQCSLPAKEARPVLKKLVREGLVVEGELLPGKAAPQYCWAARWAEVTERDAASSKQQLETIIQAAGAEPGELDLDSEPVRAFCDYVINQYHPPKEKRFLVFFQCSVRRPFSSSPSHGSMKRAIRVATGYDPRRDFESCPVHVVVLASKIGPVPYELEDIYPANVRGGGVKHFSEEYYERVKPILAERIAEYITSHRKRYDHIATFTEGRYGEVMEEARDLAGVDFPALPVKDGAIIVRMGNSKPRTYWQKYWIQLFLEIVSWLDPDQQAAAEKRLKELKVVYR